MVIAQQLNFIKHFLIFPLVALFVFSACTENQSNQPIKNEIIQPAESKLESTGTFVLFPIQQSIRSKTNGTIEFLCQNGSVKKGQRIALLNNQILFKTITTKKLSLQNELNELIPAFPKPIAAKTLKWENYSASISPRTRLPKIPTFEFKEELECLKTIQFIEKVNELILLESKMKSYFYLAPCSGIFTHEVSLKKGKLVRTGNRIGTVLQTKKVRIHVSKKEWELNNNSLEFHTSDGNLILTNWKKIDSNATDSLAFEAETNFPIPEKRNWIPIQ